MKLRGHQVMVIIACTDTRTLDLRPAMIIHNRVDEGYARKGSIILKEEPMHAL